MKNGNLNSVIALLLLISFVMLAACNKKQPATDTKQSGSGEIPIRDILEDLDDPEFYKQTRLQFTWKRDDELTSIWSINVDGSDLRRVVKTEKLHFDDTTNLNETPVRSPNRRYLAYSNSRLGTSYRNIIDLKTGEVTKLLKGSNAPSFSWTPDGKSLFFYTNFKFYRYYMETKKLEETEYMFWSSGFKVLDDGKTIVAVNRTGVSYQNYIGKPLAEFKLWEEGKIPLRRSISVDGYFMYLKDDTHYIYKLDSPPKLIKKMKLHKWFSGRFELSKKYNYSYYISRFIFRGFDIKNKEALSIYQNRKDSGFNHMSIVY